MNEIVEALGEQMQCACIPAARLSYDLSSPEYLCVDVVVGRRDSSLCRRRFTLPTHKREREHGCRHSVLVAGVRCAHQPPHWRVALGEVCQEVWKVEVLCPVRVCTL